MKKLILMFSILLLTGCGKIVSPNTNTAKSLSDAYKNYFDIGVAVTSNNLNSLISNGLLDEYDTFTAEYEMKWGHIQTSSDTFNFNNCDIIADFARTHNKEIRGHTLVWRTDIPNFISNIYYEPIPTSQKLDKVLEYLKDYYIKMNDRYGDVINVWDVLNEVIEDTNSYLYRHDNDYFKLCDYNDEIFEGFVKDVLKMVKEVSPSVTRYYNDYFILTDDTKRSKVVEFIKRINKDELLIEGIGMQSHITTSITKKQVDDAIYDFKELGIVISFTELDVSIYENDTIAPTLPARNINYLDYETKLSKAFNHVFSAARENKDIIENITFWGIYDRDSWLVGDFYNYRTDFPLLFDLNYNKKKCYYIVRDFEVIV